MPIPSSTVAAEGRRGRRRSPEQTLKTEAAILGAAAELFLERGFAETRMEEVAELANVAKGTVYKYFPTKTAMLEAVLSEVIARPIVGVVDIPPRHGESVQAFLRRTLLPRLRAAKGRQLEGTLRLIITETSRHPDIATVYRRVVLDPLVVFLRGLAARAREGGELLGTSNALERFPLLLMTPALMATVWNGLHGPDEQWSAAEAFEALLDLVFRQDLR